MMCSRACATRAVLRDTPDDVYVANAYHVIFHIFAAATFTLRVYRLPPDAPRAHMLRDCARYAFDDDVAATP